MEGREFTSGRCRILADGFYEFTAPDDPRANRKKKWLFTLKDEPWFCIAGLWRTSEEVGEACTMLTAPPGRDVALYHNRQVVVLPPAKGLRVARSGRTRLGARVPLCQNGTGNPD